MRLIDADKLIEFIDTFLSKTCKRDGTTIPNRWYGALKRCVEEQPTIEKGEWIHVSERLPEDLELVNITWVNRNPESYYADIKDKPFTATAYYFKGAWYWFSSTTEDFLEEYGDCPWDRIDTDLEITAWMPLPEPYKAESEEV